MTNRNQRMRVSRRAILAGMAAAPDADAELLARVETFRRCHDEAVKTSEQWTSEKERVEALSDCPPYVTPAEDQKGFNRREAFMKRHGVRRLADRANQVHEQQGVAANAVFDLPAQTLQGAVEKLKIAYLAVGDGDGSGADEDLEVFQDLDNSWLANAIRDFERLASGSAMTKQATNPDAELFALCDEWRQSEAITEAANAADDAAVGRAEKTARRAELDRACKDAGAALRRLWKAPAHTIAGVNLKITVAREIDPDGMGVGYEFEDLARDVACLAAKMPSDDGSVEGENDGLPTWETVREQRKRDLARRASQAKYGPPFDAPDSDDPVVRLYREDWCRLDEAHRAADHKHDHEETGRIAAPWSACERAIFATPATTLAGVAVKLRLCLLLVENPNNEQPSGDELAILGAIADLQRLASGRAVMSVQSDPAALLAQQLAEANRRSNEADEAEVNAPKDSPERAELDRAHERAQAFEDQIQTALANTPSSSLEGALGQLAIVNTRIDACKWPAGSLKNYQEEAVTALKMAIKGIIKATGVTPDPQIAESYFSTIE